MVGFYDEWIQNSNGTRSISLGMGSALVIETSKAPFVDAIQEVTSMVLEIDHADSLLQEDLRKQELEAFECAEEALKDYLHYTECHRERQFMSVSKMHKATILPQLHLRIDTYLSAKSYSEAIFDLNSCGNASEFKSKKDDDKASKGWAKAENAERRAHEKLFVFMEKMFPDGGEVKYGGKCVRMLVDEKMTSLVIKDCAS